MLSEKHNSFFRLLKNKGFREERMTKIGLYAIGKSKTLESNKSLARSTIFKPNAILVSNVRSSGIPNSLRFWVKVGPNHSAGKNSSPSTIDHSLTVALAYVRQVSTRHTSTL